ncbi:MAG: energy transducer TonB [Bacteroidota bacterium]
MQDYHLKTLSLDDIVFENRNKAYGAYLIRQLYSDNILKALFFAGSFFALALISPVVYQYLNPAPVPIAENWGETVDLSPPPPIDPATPAPPPAPVTPPPPKMASVAFLRPEIKEDHDVTTVPPTVDDLVKANPGSITTAGDPEEDPGLEIEGPSGKGPVIISAPEADVPMVIVEQAAAFPGGTEAMLKFIKDSIKYPANALKDDVQGKVFIEFVIGKDGKMRDVKILRGIGFGCDEEALRVVRLMPDWSPPKQGGHTVSQKMIIPINYKLGS